MKVVDGRLDAMLCPDDHRELMPLSPDVFYDSANGSKVVLQRNERGAPTGLTWNVERIAGQQTCATGVIHLTKVAPLR